MGDLDAERALRERAEDLIAIARTSPRVELVEAYNDFGDAGARAGEAGDIAGEVVAGLLRDVEDALLGRGVEWIVPALPDLPDVTRLADPDADRTAGDARERTDPGGAPPLAALPPLLPARGRIAGTDGSHLIEWRDGALSLDAHPDPEADEAVAALGGRRCPCLDVRAAWLAQRDDPAILVVGARSPSDDVRVPAEAVDVGRREVDVWRNRARSLQRDLVEAGDTAGARRIGDVIEHVERRISRRLGFLTLLTLPAPLLARLQAEAIASRLAAADGRSRLVLDIALRSRVRRALGDAGRAEVAAGTLPATWLLDVWARGLGVVGGRFVTAVHGDPASGLVADLAGGGKVELAFGVDGWETEVRPEP